MGLCLHHPLCCDAVMSPISAAYSSAENWLALFLLPFRDSTVTWTYPKSQSAVLDLLCRHSPALREEMLTNIQLLQKWWTEEIMECGEACTNETQRKRTCNQLNKQESGPEKLRLKGGRVWETDDVWSPSSCPVPVHFTITSPT